MQECLIRLQNLALAINSTSTDMHSADGIMALFSGIKAAFGALPSA
jgi:hypothetical protein